MSKVAAIGFALIVLLAGLHAASGQTPAICGLSAPAFCETFSSAATNGSDSRSGQLDGTLWGVSRASGNNNFSAPSNGWTTTTLHPCGLSGIPPNDVGVCNGQLVEGQNDGGTVTTLAMYPKQPFDFAGRTGKITFDVGNDTQGTHAAWPELWVSDKPVPAPFTHEESWRAYPYNGFGIRFAASPCNNQTGLVGIDSAVVIRNGVADDSFGGVTDSGLVHNLIVNANGCVRQPTSAGQLNHYEVDVSQASINVYGTDAGQTAPLVLLATIPTANLAFTRGLIWIEDAHYNANKFNGQRDHTFIWDNVGFDGPPLPRDLTFDVPDNTVASVDNDGEAGHALGYFVNGDSHPCQQGQSSCNGTGFAVHGVSNIAQATGAYLLLNFWDEAAPNSFTYSVNGHSHVCDPWSQTPCGSLPAPLYKDPNVAFSPRTLTLPISVSDVVAGDNAITITPSVAMHVFNLDLLLVAAGGLPCGTSCPTPTPTTTPTVSPTATPTVTATPSPTASPLPSPSPTPSRTPPPPPTLTPAPQPSSCPGSVMVSINGKTPTMVPC